MEALGSYDVGGSQSALMEGGSYEDAIAPGLGEPPEIVHSAHTPASDQGHTWHCLPHAGDRSEVRALLETDPGKIDHEDVTGSDCCGARRQSARRLVEGALPARKCAHGNRHAAPQVQAERHLM